MTLRHATLRQLQVFEAVARKLSFARAASELHLTQPAVSMQVKSLEQQAGLALFERIGKKIFLTELGAELHRHSRAIAQQLREADETLAARKGMAQGRLHIAMVSTAQYLVPPLLAVFLKRHPGVTLKLWAGNRELALKQLADNEVDFAVMGQPPERIGAVAEAFARHPHVVIAAPAHPLSKKRRIALARLAEETFLIREPGSGTRALLERLFAEQRLPLNVSMEIASNEAIKQAVQADMGISLLSLHTIGLELKTRRLAILDVRGLPLVRDWYVVRLAAKRLSPVAQAFRTFLLTEAGRLIPAK